MPAFKERSRSKFYFAAFMLASILFNSHPSAAAGRSFESFQEQINQQLEEGLRRKSLGKSLKAAEYRYESTKFQSPWNIETDLSTVLLNSDSKMPFSAPGNVDINFVNRDGFEFRSHNEINNRSLLYPDHNIPLRGTLTFGKDISKGGKRSPANIQAEIRRTQSRADYLRSEAKYLFEVISIQPTIAAYYNTLCRLQDIDLARGPLKEITEASKIKLDARALSLRDHLRFVDVANTLDTQRQNLIETIADLQVQLSAQGDGVVNIARNLSKENSMCQDASTLVIDKPDKNDIAVTAHIRNLPGIRLLDASKETERKEAEFLKSDLKMKLVPYAGAAYLSDDNNGRAEGIIGVRLVYNFEGPDKSLEIKSKLEKVSEIINIQRQSVMDSERDVQSLIRAIERSSNMTEVLQARITTSRELLRVIKVQLSLGLIDPILTSQAYLSYFDAIRELRDNWEKAATARLQLKQLERAKMRVDEGLKGVTPEN